MAGGRFGIAMYNHDEGKPAFAKNFSGGRRCDEGVRRSPPGRKYDRDPRRIRRRGVDGRRSDKADQNRE
jgi:hypothetical protein